MIFRAPVIFSLVICVSFALPHYSYAEDEDAGTETSLLEKTGYVALIEGLFAVNAGLATLSPRVYGGVGLVLLPLGLTGKSAAMDATGASLFASLCIYNLVVPASQDLSDSEVFVHNMIGWHVFALGLGVASLFANHDKNEKPQQALSFGVNVGPGSTLLVARYRF